MPCKWSRQMHKFTHAKARIWLGQTPSSPSYLQLVISLLHILHLSITTHVVTKRTGKLRRKVRISSSITSADKGHSGYKAPHIIVTSELDGDEQAESLFRHSSADDMAPWTHGQKAEWIPFQGRYNCGGETKNSSQCRKLNTSRAAFSDYLLPYHHRTKPSTTFKAKFLIHYICNPTRYTVFDD